MATVISHPAAHTGPEAGTKAHYERKSDPAVVALDDLRAQSAELVGAKAAALAAARRAGLRVLPGFVLTTKFDPSGEASLRQAWSELSGAGERPLVVRSSSTVEDSSVSSMAGLFTSVLDVRGWERFRRAVETVMASSNVVAIAGAPAPMAVLVQPHLNAVSGGVLFGRDPISGRRDRLMVSASEHGPSAVVSGVVDGTRYVLDRWGRRREGPRAGVLDSRQLRRLTRVAHRAESIFGAPQDIEWAFGAGGLSVLQTRPITALGDADAARGPVYGPGPVAETFPDPLSPLEEDLWAEPLRDALREALDLAGTVPRGRLDRAALLVSVGGRLAVDLDLLEATSRRRSGLARLDPRPSIRRLLAAWRVGRLRAALPAMGRDLIVSADDDMASVGPLEPRSDAELLRLLAGARGALVALHTHEILMGWLVDAGGASITAAGVAMGQLAGARARGLGDEEIIALHPTVLALVPPRIGPDGPALPPVDHPPEALMSGGRATPPAVIVREALRLRVRWLQELTARTACELGRRLTARQLLEQPGDVALLRRAELEAAVNLASLPADLASRRALPSAPLPTRFRLTPTGAVVAPPTGGGAGGGQGSGGGRGMGRVHSGPGLPAPGSVLVVRNLDPRLAGLLPRLSGLVAETGSPLSHLALLARELGVATVVGVDGATTTLAPGSLVVVDGASGEVTVAEPAPVGAVEHPVTAERGAA